MLKRLMLLPLLAIAISCTTVKEHNDRITVKKHSVKALHADIDLAQRVLKEGHPGLYWYISKKELDHKFDSLKKAITTPLTTAQFYQKFTPVIASIKCGHTALKYPAIAYKNKKERQLLTGKVAPLNQFTYAIQDHQLFVTANKSAQKELKAGAQLLTIEGLETTEMIKTMESGLSYDGYHTNSRDRRLELTFAQLYKIYYPDKDSLSVTYKLDNDSIVHSFIKGFTKKKVAINKTNKAKDTVKQVQAPVKKVEHARFKGKAENGEIPLDFKFLDGQKHFAYMKIKSFSVPTANFDQFYKVYFDSIRLAGSENLILDLRNNPGGTLRASMQLFAYLTDKEFIYLDKPTATGHFNANKYGNTWQKIKYYARGFNDDDALKQDSEGNYYKNMPGYKPAKPNKNNYKGKLFVLINEYTFSAASLLSANLKGINRATFIGKETGGGANQCTAGTLPIVPLKNSKLALRFGLYKMGPVHQEQNYGRGIFPDVELASSVKDKINGNDIALQWILNENKTKE